MNDDIRCVTCGHPEDFHNTVTQPNRCNALVLGPRTRCPCTDFIPNVPEEPHEEPPTIAYEPERATPPVMNLTTSESEMNCLLHAAEKYAADRKTQGKPTSIIDTLIERLKASPQNHDLVFVRRPSFAVTCLIEGCTSLPARDGYCLIHAPKDPFV